MYEKEISKFQAFRLMCDEFGGEIEEDPLTWNKNSLKIVKCNLGDDEDEAYALMKWLKDNKDKIAENLPPDVAGLEVDFKFEDAEGSIEGYGYLENDGDVAIGLTYSPH